MKAKDERAMIAAESLTLNTGKVKQVASNVMFKRMRDMSQVSKLRLDRVEGEKGTYHYGRTKNDNLSIQMLWRWEDLLKESRTKKFKDEGSRITAQTAILANMTSLVKTMDEQAGKAFSECMALLAHDVKLKESKKSGRRDTSELTDAELVAELKKSRSLTPDLVDNQVDKGLPSQDDSEPIVIENEGGFGE